MLGLVLIYDVFIILMTAGLCCIMGGLLLKNNSC